MAFLPRAGATNHSEASRGVGTQVGQARSSVDRGSRDTSRGDSGRFRTSAQRAAAGGPVKDTARAVADAARWVSTWRNA